MMRSWLTGALLLLRIYFFNMQSSIYHPASVARKIKQIRSKENQGDCQFTDLF
ncbi:hypothetical protein P5673_011923 [Acropora cervicornis]|uniref:Uncharacterized protein n=1 Tax=Acropora cervicornis TaxID=6130 RepID=A0AAD9V7S7_ACRCE|nr:hypothetical protein P5673_011923 [Acropora cervicornis]